VIERGRIVEDGNPQTLAQTASARFRRLLQVQKAMQVRFAAGGEWRRVRLDSGHTIQEHVNSTIQQTA
jgi:hypothetical protein